MDAFYLFIYLFSANSSSEIKVLSTEHGIVLYSMVTCYNEDLRVGWLHRHVKLSFLDAILIPHWCGYHKTQAQTNMTTTILNSVV